MIIQETYELNIFVDGVNVFEAPGVILLSAEIIEAIDNPIPSCELRLSVPLGWFNERSFVDGTLLRFEIKDPKQNLYEDLRFRLFNIEEVNINQNFVVVQFDGVLDFHEGYREANYLNQYSTSSDLFKHIASTFKLKNDIDNTNDLQLWIAGENNLYQFMTKTTEYGWEDDTSAMFWCFDRHKVLLYKNLTTLFRRRSDDIGTFIQQGLKTNAKNKIYSYVEAQGYIQSGYENLANQGYGGEDHYFDLLSYQWKEVTARKVIAESNLINISKELSNGLAQSWYPFNVGNFHDHYYLAYKQNKRILSTYSSYVNLSCSYFMPYRLGQIVNFHYTDSQDDEIKVRALSGVFAICAIKIKINTRSITCNLQLMMQGLNGTAARETY